MQSREQEKYNQPTLRIYISTNNERKITRVERVARFLTASPISHPSYLAVALQRRIFKTDSRVLDNTCKRLFVFILKVRLPLEWGGGGGVKSTWTEGDFVPTLWLSCRIVIVSQIHRSYWITNRVSTVTSINWVFISHSFFSTCFFTIWVERERVFAIWCVRMTTLRISILRTSRDKTVEHWFWNSRRALVVEVYKGEAWNRPQNLPGNCHGIGSTFHFHYPSTTFRLLVCPFQLLHQPKNSQICVPESHMNWTPPYLEIFR